MVKVSSLCFRIDLYSFTLIYVNWPSSSSCFQSLEKDALLYRKKFPMSVAYALAIQGHVYLKMLLRQNDTQDQTK